MVESEVHKGPARVIYTRGGRDVVSSDEDEGPVDVFPELFAGVFVEEVGDEGGDGADPEEVEEGGVDAADGVETTGADEAPDDGGGVDGSTVGTGEAVGLVGGADVLDVAEHPDGDAGLGEGAEDGGEALGHEEGARGDFEVVAEFHVHGEVDTLADDVGAEDFEDHVGEGFAFEHVAADEFGEDVELVGVDVGDALDDAAGDHVDGGDDEAEEDAVDGELGVVDFDHHDGDGGDDGDDGGVPVPGGLFVGSHETGVDVELVFAFQGGPDFFAVPDTDVGEDGGDGGEG